MKKILCLILISTLLFSISCNVSDGGDILSEPPVESKAEATEVQLPEESGSTTEESLEPEESSETFEENLEFERGYTSVDLARQLKPLMTVLKTIDVLGSYPHLTSSIGRHSYTLAEGGTLLFFSESSKDILEDMQFKENESLVVKAVVIHENGYEETLFDVSEDQTCKSDMIIYDTPMIPYDATKKVQPYMTPEEVVELIGDPRGTVDWFSPYKTALYTLEDRRIFYIYYSTDDNGSTTAVYAWIYSEIQSRNEIIFDVRS